MKNKRYFSLEEDEIMRNVLYSFSKLKGIELRNKILYLPLKNIEMIL